MIKILRKKNLTTAAIICLAAVTSITAAKLVAKSMARRHSAKPSETKPAMTVEAAPASLTPAQLATYKEQVRAFTEQNFEHDFEGFTKDAKVKLDLLALAGNNRDFGAANPGVTEKGLSLKTASYENVTIPARVELFVELNDTCIDNHLMAGGKPVAPTYQLAITKAPVKLKELAALYAAKSCVRHVFLNRSISKALALRSKRAPEAPSLRAPASVPQNMVVPEIVRLNTAVAKTALENATVKTKNPKAVVELPIAVIARDERIKSTRKGWFLKSKLGEIADLNSNSKIMAIGDRSVRISRLEYPLETPRDREVAELNNLIIRAVQDGARIIVIPPVQLSSVYTAVTYAAINRVQVATP